MLKKLLTSVPLFIICILISLSYYFFGDTIGTESALMQVEDSDVVYGLGSRWATAYNCLDIVAKLYIAAFIFYNLKFSKEGS